jgi:hypothetical protein
MWHRPGFGNGKHYDDSAAFKKIPTYRREHVMQNNPAIRNIGA